MTHECYKPSLEERFAILEDENIETNNMLYELNVDIDMLKERLKTLENLLHLEEKFW